MTTVMAVDFSAVTTRMLDTVAALCNSATGMVYVIHVAAPEPVLIGYDAGPAVVRQQVAHEYRTEHHQVAALAESLAARGVAATPLLVQGSTVNMILAEADRLHADLIVVGSHGHGAVYDILVGSVSEGVVRRATLPVMVVPARISRA